MLNAGCAINIMQHDGPWLIREREKGGGTRKFKFFFFFFVQTGFCFKIYTSILLSLQKLMKLGMYGGTDFFNLDDA